MALSQKAIDATKSSLSRHLRNCRVALEQGGEANMVTGDDLQGLLGTQRDLYRHLSSAALGSAGDSYIVNKPRQAGSTTICAAWGLRESLYSPGCGTLLMCNKDETNAEVWGRVRYMYDNLPDAVKVPVKKSSEKELACAPHSGRFKVVTAKGNDPALGFSVDRAVFSEFNFWDNAEETFTKLLGTFGKRKHFRGVIESTPGPMGSYGYRKWIESITNKDALFKAVFLRWFDYKEYTDRVPVGVTLTNDEARYMEKWGLGEKHLGHMMFRRRIIRGLAGSTGNPEKKFDFLYPPDPYTGWQIDGEPPLDLESIEWLRGTTAKKEDSKLGEVWDWGSIVSGNRHAIFCDPASYGDGKDPEAYCVFDLDRRLEVGAWCGKVGPIKLAEYLAKLGKRLNNCPIVIESNAAATITALITGGYPNVYGAGGSHPGWYRTGASKQRAEARLDIEIQSRKFIIQSMHGLTQLGAWNGSYVRVGGHHWDRVITYQIAADMLSIWGIPVPAAEPVVSGWSPPNYGLLDSTPEEDGDMRW